MPTARDGAAGGFYCYLATPFDNSGEVATGVLAEYAARIAESGVAGVTCLASTCEGPYLSDAERRLVVTTVGKAVRPKLKFNVGVGAHSTRQVIENAKCARDAGATSLMLEMQQYFPVTFAAAYTHYEAVARAVNLPIRLYNLTLPTRFDFTPDKVFEMGAIAAIASVKEASGEVSRLRDIRALCGNRFELYCGFHYQALEGFRFGADGWEVMLHPHIAKPIVALYEALKSDPWSAAAQDAYMRLQPLFHFFKQFGVPHSIKAISEWTDLRFGGMRAPLLDLAPAQKQRLRSILGELELT